MHESTYIKQQQEQQEAQLKSAAWLTYVGSQFSFEQDWPAIRARLMADVLAEQQRKIREQHSNTN